MSQEKIKNRLNTAKEIDGVTVTVSDEAHVITLSHERNNAADFVFRWVDGNHYVGYFVDNQGGESQGVVSLWSPLDATKFVAVYATLIELRARR